MRDIFVVLSVLVTVPMILRWPHVGILAWCWISYMNPHRLTWGFAYNAPLAMVVALATLVAWMASKEPKRVPVNAVTGFLIALVFWMTFANLFAMLPAEAYVKWEQAIKILIMTFVTLALCTTRERLHALIWVIVASLAFFGLKGGIFTLMGGGGNLVWGPPGSFITDNNALALALIMVLPLVRYLQIHTDHKLLRWALYPVFVLCIFSILGSSSRGAFLALGATAVFMVLKSRHRLVMSLGVIVMLMVSAAFVPQHWIDRMKTIETFQEDGSAMGRLQVWGFAIKVALDRPIVGGGFRVSYSNEIYKRYVPGAEKSRNFHSVYFEVLGELGFPGIFIFLGLLFATWRCGSSIIAATKGREDLVWANDLARMLQISLVGFAVGGAFQNLAFYDLYYHIIAILFLTQQIVARTIQASAGVQMPMVARPPASGAPAARHRAMTIGPGAVRRPE